MDGTGDRHMAQILMIAVNRTNPDADADRKHCYKIGMPIVVVPDNHQWGAKECPPTFYLIKVPGISLDKVRKFIAPEYETFPDENGDPIIYRRRVWQVRVADLPQAVRDKFINNGEVIIKAGAYDGAYDYTWDQVKTYFRNLSTGLDGAELD
jgi:hypothetical protein